VSHISSNATVNNKNNFDTKQDAFRFSLQPCLIRVKAIFNVIHHESEHTFSVNTSVCLSEVKNNFAF